MASVLSFRHLITQLAICAALLLSLSADAGPPILEVVRKQGKSHELDQRLHENAAQRARREQREREEQQAGVSHFRGFDGDTDSYAWQALSGHLAGRGPVLAVTTSTALHGGEILVRISRYTADSVVTRAAWVTKGSSLHDAYAKAFEGSTVELKGGSYEADLRDAHLVLDSSMFHEPFSPSESFYLRTPRYSPVSVLQIPSSTSTGVVRWRDLSRPFYDLYPYSLQDGRSAYLLRTPNHRNLLTLPPPTRASERLHELQSAPFSRKDLSVILLEGEPRTREILNDASKQGKINLAGDYSAGSFTSSSLGNLELQFKLRAGKSIAVVGHYEKASSEFQVRNSSTVLGSVSRGQLLEWGRQYNVNVLLLGCRTAEIETGNLFAATPIRINSVDVMNALVESSSNSSNWAEFFGTLASERVPLLIGESQPLGNGSGAGKFLRRTSNGRLNVVATLQYYVRCSAFSQC